MNNSQRKVALVTGASKGIGEAVAMTLSKNNIQVVLAARSLGKINAIADIIRDRGGEAIAIECDVSSYSDVNNAVNESIKWGGRIDILVNNAGLIEPIATLEDSDHEAWSSIIDINFKGVYYGIRTVIPHMKAAGGTIINISSGAATSALEGWSHYCSSKAGVLSLTRCAAKELEPFGIRVIGLSPGTVATDMQLAIRQSGINPVSQLDPSVHISTDWVAETVHWLCSENGDEYTGTDFSLKSEDSKRIVGLT